MPEAPLPSRPATAETRPAASAPRQPSSLRRWLHARWPWLAAAVLLALAAGLTARLLPLRAVAMDEPAPWALR
ncbi:hypothetical protein [Elioraea thermophila]|uniref:hypothetical protein n=1 Tax=Elioraea thermophila TaxID=2185104 RepID=UPI0018E4F64D|nr:hypothetical protein [Elioraea thermophila]